MSTEYREAAAAADKLGSFIEMLDRVRKVVATAARAEQDEQNAKDRVKAAQDAASQAEALTASAVEQLQDAQGKVTAAKAEAQQVVADAQASAIDILTEARSEAARITDVAQSKLKIAREEGEKVAQQHRDVEAELVAARAELAEIQTKIEAAKADARARFA